jgi:tetratricopeptide (TPR) repeat protein
VVDEAKRKISYLRCRMLKSFLRYLIFFVIFFFAVSTQAKVKIDSVKNVYKTSTDPLKRAAAMSKIIVWYQQTYDSANFYFNIAIKDFRNSNYKFGEAWANHAFGIACAENAHYEDAKKHLNEAISQYVVLGNDSMIGKAKGRVAFIYYTQADYEASIKTYLESIKAAQKANDLGTEAWATSIFEVLHGKKRVCKVE